MRAESGESVTRELRDAPQFYLTAPSPCPYLPGSRSARSSPIWSASARPRSTTLLTQTGFRRSQTIAYRPACESCRGLRLGARAGRRFQPERQSAPVAPRQRRSRRRARRAEADDRAIFPVSRLSRRPPPRRRHGRHVGRSIFAMMVEDTHIDTHLVEYRRRTPTGDRADGAGRSIAVCLTDRLADGLSLVYSFYDPDEPRALARLLHHSRSHRKGAPPRPAACLSRLLGRGLEEDGLQGALPAAGAARPERLEPGGAVGDGPDRRVYAEILRPCEQDVKDDRDRGGQSKPSYHLIEPGLRAALPSPRRPA